MERSFPKPFFTANGMVGRAILPVALFHRQVAHDRTSPCTWPQVGSIAHESRRDAWITLPWSRQRVLCLRAVNQRTTHASYVTGDEIGWSGPLRDVFLPSRAASLSTLTRKGERSRKRTRDRSRRRQQRAHPQRRLIPLGHRTTATNRFHIRSSGAKDSQLLRQYRVLPRILSTKFLIVVRDEGDRWAQSLGPAQLRNGGGIERASVFRRIRAIESPLHEPSKTTKPRAEKQISLNPFQINQFASVSVPQNTLCLTWGASDCHAPAARHFRFGSSIDASPVSGTRARVRVSALIGVAAA